MFLSMANRDDITGVFFKEFFANGDSEPDTRQPGRMPALTQRDILLGDVLPQQLGAVGPFDEAQAWKVGRDMAAGSRENRAFSDLASQLDSDVRRPGKLCNGKDCDNHPDNQYLLFAYSSGRYQPCTKDGVCGTVDVVR